MNERGGIYERHYFVTLVRLSLSLLIGYKCLRYSTNHSFYFQDQFYFVLYACLGLVLVIAYGYQVRKCCLCLLVILTSYEQIMETYSLGSSYCNMILIFFCISCHRGFPVKECGRFTFSTGDSIKIIFLICTVVNFSAAILHMKDPYWQNGTALSLILNNSFYTNYYDFFEGLQKRNPDEYLFATQLFLWAQIVFQIIMLPLSFLKYGFLIIRIWGILFSILILFIFQISLLPVFSLTFWVLTFYLPVDHKFEIKYFLTTKSLNRHIAIYTGISLFLLSSLSLLIKTFNDHKTTGSIPKSSKEILAKNQTERITLILCNYIGLCVPNVFNTQDILSNTKWVVIYNIIDDKKRLIPFVATDGSRLSYHGSNIICYKASIPIRRSLLSNDLNQTIKHLVKVSLYDNRKNPDSRSDIYEFAFFERSSSQHSSRLEENVLKSPFLVRRVDINSYL